MNAKDKGLGWFTRRGFLYGSSALLTGAMFRVSSVAAQEAGTGREQAKSGVATPASMAGHVIDVHHHFLPPYYQQLAVEMGGEPQHWTPGMSLERMDTIGIQAAVLSISNWIAGAKEPTAEQILRLCRECNDFGAKMVQQYPRRFGFLASLMTLPDVDASLKELEYAMDTLKADGVGLMSHYGPGAYLGDPAMAPVYEEMNRRGVVAFVHPANGWYDYRFEPGKNPVKLPSLGAAELPIDTTRALLNCLGENVAEKYPNIKFIWAHGGGGMLMLLCRSASVTNDGTGYEPMYDRLSKAVSSWYYDLTNTISPPAIHGLLAAAPASHLLFGTDIPRGGNGRFSPDLLAALPSAGIPDAQIQNVIGGNAQTLFPRLRQKG